MIHPHTALRFIDRGIGHGVVATRPIPRGTVTWVLDPLDQVLTAERIAALPSAMHFDRERHTFIRADGFAILPWDLTQFVNHCCEPNSLSTAEGFEIAVRDIVIGEQLSNDYANLGLRPTERLPCECGAFTCRGLVVPADQLRLNARWEKEIAAALEEAPHVPQPLSGLLTTGQRERIRAARRPTHHDTVVRYRFKVG